VSLHHLAVRLRLVAGRADAAVLVAREEEKEAKARRRAEGVQGEVRPCLVAVREAALSSRPGMHLGFLGFGFHYCCRFQFPFSFFIFTHAEACADQEDETVPLDEAQGRTCRAELIFLRSETYEDSAFYFASSFSLCIYDFFIGVFLRCLCVYLDFE
jgi:hypothetical protein